MVAGALALCLSCQHDPPGQLKLVVTTFDIRLENLKLLQNILNPN